MNRRSFIKKFVKGAVVAPAITVVAATINRRLGLVETIMELTLDKPDDIYKKVDSSKEGFKLENGDIILTKQRVTKKYPGLKILEDALKWEYLHVSVMLGEKEDLSLIEYTGEYVKKIKSESLNYIINHPDTYHIFRTSHLKPNAKAALAYAAQVEKKEPIFDYLSFFTGLGPETFKFYTKDKQTPLVACTGFVQNVLYAGGLDVTKTNPVGFISPDNFVNCHVYKRDDMKTEK